MSGTGICRRLQLVPEISFLGLVMKVGSGPDCEQVIRLDGRSSASTKLAVVKLSPDSQSITMMMCDGLSIANVIRAFEYLGIPVTSVDFELSRGEEISKYFVAQSADCTRTRGSVGNSVSFERPPALHTNGGFFKIPYAVDKETMVRSGTVLETMIYLLYVLGNQNFGNLTFSEPLHFLCRATQSKLPGRVFLLTLHRPAPGKNFTLEIVHSRMGDSYPNMYELQTVSVL